MKHIFYFIGIAFIIYEMMWIFNPQAQVEKVKEMKEEGKMNKGLNWDDYSEHYKSLLKTQGLASLIFSLWFFCGLLTFNWLAFLFKIIFNFIIIAPISRLLQYNSAYTALHWVNSLIGFAFGVFVILNSYHLKIDLYSLFLAFI